MISIRLIAMILALTLLPRAGYALHPMAENTIEQGCEIVATRDGLQLRVRVKISEKTLTRFVRVRDPQLARQRFMASYSRHIEQSFQLTINDRLVPVRISSATFVQRHHSYFEWRAVVPRDLASAHTIELRQSHIWCFPCTSRLAFRARGLITIDSNVGPNWLRRLPNELKPFELPKMITARIDTP